MKKLLKKVFPFNHIASNKVKVCGENNKIIIVDENNNETMFSNSDNLAGLRITLTGKNNTIKLYKPFGWFNGSHLEVDSQDAFVEIGKRCFIENVHMRLKYGRSQKLSIGDRTTIYGGAIVLDEDSSAIIGSDCLIADGFDIRASDGHSIIDKDTKELLNRVSKPVVIGDHCWFGLNVHVLKHTKVPKNCIIGTQTLLSGIYEEENTIISGVPGKIIRRGVDWNSESPLRYKPSK